MIILRIHTLLNKEVVLSAERWNHIIRKHPEIKQPEQVTQVLSNPEIIIYNPTTEGIIYQRKRDDGYVTVVLNREQTFVITAFVAEHIKKGEIIWQKNS